MAEEKKKFNYGTLKEAIKKWNNKETVWSVEMGGLGPGYEQCIQVMIFEMCSELVNVSVPESAEDKSATFNTTVKPIISKLDEKMGGFSGAQVDAAKNVAFRFWTRGYNECLNVEAIKDRKIQVEDSWEYKPKTQASPSDDVEKCLCFVAHIDNHLVEMVDKGEIERDAKVMCKICNKDIDTIYKEERANII